MKFTDINPLPEVERCQTDCPGWFIEHTDGRPEACDECARAAKRHGIDEVTDADAFDVWRHHVLELVEDLVKTTPQQREVDALFPELR